MLVSDTHSNIYVQVIFKDFEDINIIVCFFVCNKHDFCVCPFWTVQNDISKILYILSVFHETEQFCLKGFVCSLCIEILCSFL